MNDNVLEIVNILKDNRIVEKVNEEHDKIISTKLNEEESDFTIEYSENPLYIELNGFSDPSKLEKYFIESLTKFKKSSADTRLDKNKILQNELIQSIFSIRTELTQLLLVSPSKKFRNYNSLVTLKISYCDKILLFISNIKNEVSKLNRKGKGDYTNLKQKHIVILFHHMHSLGYIGKGMDNTEFADLIAEITDFSSNRIRQDFSNILDMDSLDFLQSDYSEVIKALNKIRSSVETESKARLQPKP